MTEIFQAYEIRLFNFFLFFRNEEILIYECNTSYKW